MLDALSGARVLLTGHTGFKGAWAIPLLRSLGASVYGYALEPPTTPSLFEDAALADLCERHVVADVRDYDRLLAEMRTASPDLVLHLAAQPLVIDGYRDPRGTFEIDTMGTVNVLEAIRQVGTVRCAVVVTTDKVYQPSAGEPHREGAPLGGPDPYSASKAAAELVAASYRSSYFGDAGTIVATARAGNVIGGGDWAPYRLLADAARSMLGDRTLTLRNPASVRPWQHVLDALWGYLLVADRGLSGDRSVGRAWNFGPRSADHLTVQQVIDRFAAEYGEPLEVRVEPGEVHENPLLALDASDARTALGWGTMAADEAIAMTASWYRDQAGGAEARSCVVSQIEAFLGRVQP